MKNLLKNVMVTRVLVDTADGGSDTLSSDIIDMLGFEGVMFICKLGNVTDTAVLTLTAQQNIIDSTSGMATLAGYTVTYTCGATNADNDLLILDIYKPEERYLRAQLQRATANAVVNGIIAIQYGGVRKTPITQGTTVLDSEQVISPAEA